MRRLRRTVKAAGREAARVLLLVLSVASGGLCILFGVIAEDLSLLARRLRRVEPWEQDPTLKGGR